jgi:hypothetical protein
MKRPRTPPYLLLALYATFLASALVDLLNLLLSGQPSLVDVATTIARLVIPALLMWLAGTLPLLETLPSPDIAGLEDVRLSY